MSDSNTNALEVSVSELSAKLKRTVEDTFGNVRVRGEISGYRGPHSSGHSYFSIKDDRARLEAVIWRGQASKMKFLPEEGMEVIATGKLTTYPGSSKYQIVIDGLEPAGAGALMALLEERKKKLGAEGLFDEARKQLLPYLPKVIAVVTSPTGAVIRDVLHRISDRYPLHVLVWPVRVQGDTSGPEVANGVRQLNALPEDGAIPRPDLIIVARGGGSLEDLWGFNDEVVVRAVSESMVPVISAVGHETDWTLIDLAADWRAPTPTGAAEKAVPVKAELEAYVADLGARVKSAQVRLFDKRRSELTAAMRGLSTPDNLLALPRRRFDDAERRLGRSLESCTQQKRSAFDRTAARLSPSSLRQRTESTRDRLHRAANANARAMTVLTHTRRFELSALEKRVTPLQLVAQIERGQSKLLEQQTRLRQNFSRRIEILSARLERSASLLQSVSYERVLERGFALVRDEAGAPLRSIAQVSHGDHLHIRLLDGEVDATANSTRASTGKPVAKPSVKLPGNPGAAAAKKKTRSAKEKKPTDQGSLF